MRKKIPSDRRPILWSAAWLLLLLGPCEADAAEVDLEFVTIGQGYQTETAAGSVLDRRRLAEWISFRAGRLLGSDDLSLQVSLRLDLELGLPDSMKGRQGADLPLAVLRWRGVLDRLDLYLGRQVLLDELDFLLFDGLRAELKLPGRLTLRLVGGFTVRDKSFLGGEVLELDGVEAGVVPAPVVGASLLFAWEDLWAGVDYRRVALWEDGWPVDEERLGASASLRFIRGQLGFDAGATYNLVQDRWDRLRADAFFWLSRAGNGFRLEGGYLRSRPLFALDSIFNFFAPAPFDEFHGGVRWGLDSRGSVALAYHHRRYAPEENLAGADGAGWSVDGGDLDARWKTGRATWVSLAASYEDGASGRRILAVPAVTWWILPDTLQIEGRGFAGSFEDPVQVRQQAWTFGGSAGATWWFGVAQALMLVVEANGNRLQPFQTRLLLVLDLAFHFGPGGFL